MSENVRLPWGVSRVESFTLDLLEDEERRCLDLSVLQCSILRQMAFPWAYQPNRLVEDHGDYQTVIEMPEAYLDALDELMELLSGAYDGPVGGCPVGEIYIDRGDLPGYDFALANLTADGAWHEMDLTNVIGEGSATRVLIRALHQASAVGGLIRFREAGNVDAVNIAAARVQVANAALDMEGVVKMSGAQKIEYLLSTVTTAAFIVVRGYWMPAV